MKQAQLFKLARRVLDSKFASLGFQYDCGVYYRELPSRIMHLVGLSLDPRTTDTFQVMCGLSSRLLYPDARPMNMGFAGRRDCHLSPNGWYHSSGAWPCADEPAALESLTRISGQIDTLVEPWFRSLTKLSDLADALDTELLGIHKARLYLADGKPEQARSTLIEYLNRLQKSKPWDDPKWLEDEKREVNKFLRDLQA